MAKERKIQLGAFVEAYGQGRLAEALGISRQAIYHWQLGNNVPNVLLAYRIIKLSNGLVDFNSIYLPYCELAEDTQKNLNNKEG